MDERVVTDLAICIATDPEPHTLMNHLAKVTFITLRPYVLTLYMQVDTSEGAGLILVAQHGLTAEEETRYTHIQRDFPLPATAAMRHHLPFADSMADLAVQFPLLNIRPELAHDVSQLGIPITLQGVTVGAVLVTLSGTFTWNPDTWQVALGIQSLLGLYVRTTERMWSPLRPRSPEFAHRQGLTERQVAILQLVGDDRPTSSIANRLGFSESTIKQDLRRAMIALQVHDRHHAVTRARELGLIPTS